MTKIVVKTANRNLKSRLQHKMEKEISEAIDILRKVIKNKNLKIDDNKILEESIKIAITRRTEQGKDKRTEQIQQPVKNNFEPATIKQKEYLHGLGINFPKDISKFEAHKLIEENKGKI